MKLVHVRLLLLVLCAALVTIGPGSAWAQYADQIDVEGELDAGGTITIAATGFRPDSDVTITLESDPVVLARTKADGTGAIDVTVEIPTGFAPGAHTLKASGVKPNGAPLVLAQPVRVGDSLGRTGANLVALAVSAGGLLLVGAFAVAYRRVHS